METSSALLALCAGNSPVPVNSPHKGQWHGALMFSSICAWINDWVNNHAAGDLRRHRGHFDVNVMHRPHEDGSTFRVTGPLFRGILASPEDNPHKNAVMRIFDLLVINLKTCWIDDRVANDLKRHVTLMRRHSHPMHCVCCAYCGRGWSCYTRTTVYFQQQRQCYKYHF